jgi:hypothetical protein
MHSGMNTGHDELLRHVEKLRCDRCGKRWEASWTETPAERSVEQTLACDCGRVMKVVQATGDEPPVMILRHSRGKTIAACLPAAAAGAFYPVISEPVILAAYLLSWIACAATLVNDSNRSASALGGIFIWAIAAVSGAAAAGALAAHALWWWHQGYIAT